jgi:hypothetical protein
VDQELIDMAVMYAAVCLRKEENLWYWSNCTPCPWLWEDLIAAFELLHERDDRWQLWNTSEYCKVLQEIGRLYTKAEVFQQLSIRLTERYGWT